MSLQRSACESRHSVIAARGVHSDTATFAAGWDTCAFTRARSPSTARDAWGAVPGLRMRRACKMKPYDTKLGEIDSQDNPRLRARRRLWCGDIRAKRAGKRRMRRAWRVEAQRRG